MSQKCRNFDSKKGTEMAGTLPLITLKNRGGPSGRILALFQNIKSHRKCFKKSDTCLGLQVGAYRLPRNYVTKNGETDLELF